MDIKKIINYVGICIVCLIVSSFVSYSIGIFCNADNFIDFGLICMFFSIVAWVALLILLNNRNMKN